MLENQTYRRYIFLGESGSGKTELSLNFALKLKEAGRDNIHFFDMDQTKAMFRSRDSRDFMQAQGIHFHETVELADSPIVPHGVAAALTDPSAICVFDVGGNATGAMMIGQYEEYFHEDDTVVYYVANAFRPFAGTAEYIDRMYSHILVSCGIGPELVQFISNPCLGDETTVEDVLKGHENLLSDLRTLGHSASLLSVHEPLYEAVKDKVDCPVIPIRLFIQYL